MGKRTVSKGNGRVRTEKIVAYCRDLHDVEKKLLFVSGLPHTGKTLNAIESGLEQVLEGRYDKLVIIRPVIDLGTGYLPGDILEKMSPFTRQSKEYIACATQKSYEDLISQEKLEIMPSSALQGNHFRNCFVVIDEAQNIPRNQTFKVLSRVGDNAKFVIIGDTSTGQENVKVGRDSMLAYCVNKFTSSEREEIAIHTFFDIEDILGDDFTRYLIGTLMEDFVK